MQYFPIFIDTAGQHIAIVGGGQTALAKLRLLVKTQAVLEVFSLTPDADLREMAQAGQILLHTRAFTDADAARARMIYAADEDDTVNQTTQATAAPHGALFNWVDKPDPSEFITAAMVDRDPVVVAIGTEGAAPVVARAIKKDLEEKLPEDLGTLAALAKPLRSVADAIAPGRARRDFWTEFFFHRGPKALVAGGAREARRVLQTLALRHIGKPARTGHITVADIGPGAADLLPHKTRQALHDADVVIFPRSTPSAIRELARREALVLPAHVSTDEQAVKHARIGEQIVRLTDSADDTAEALALLRRHGVSHSHIPGVGASPAALPQSPTLSPIHATVGPN